jgi:hypothetical protein
VKAGAVLAVASSMAALGPAATHSETSMSGAHSRTRTTAGPAATSIGPRSTSASSDTRTAARSPRHRRTGGAPSTSTASRRRWRSRATTTRARRSTPRRASTQGQLGDDVDYRPVTVAVGDRVICRRNDHVADVERRHRARDAPAQRLQALIDELDAAGYTAAAKCLTDDLDALVVHLRYPTRHRRRWRSTNLLERSLAEVKRRTKVIGRFPGETSCLTLVWAVLDVYITHAKNGVRFNQLERQRLCRIEIRRQRTNERRGGERRLD